MNKFKSGLIKVGKFLKKNVYYVLIIVAVAAICTMVGVTVSRNKSNVNNDVPAVVTPENPSDDNKEPVKPDNPEDKKPVVEQIVFVTPVTGGTVAASFSETELVFSKTLEQWSTHRAVDFVAEEGSDVLAVWDGVVTAIDNDPLYGYCVSISHGDGLRIIRERKRIGIAYCEKRCEDRGNRQYDDYRKRRRRTSALRNL